MEIGVDRSLCEANAVCVGLAPDVFDLDDDEELVVRPGPVPADEVEHVTDAVKNCPKNALFITG
ncbi:ferredoxin [Amycolatopsis australiensis]|uniref:Ferredoxin n=1 Tax=Amycolatopsis australiensis TaxID=546364 RepID=A0A1K1T0E5_9PSEU|nr:ferredoxin [Amycolatopsis australiensis]SFW90006.1 ferredoxin [Amycolatopsis australiensis]